MFNTLFYLYFFFKNSFLLLTLVIFEWNLFSTEKLIPGIIDFIPQTATFQFPLNSVSGSPNGGHNFSGRETVSVLVDNLKDMKS